MYKFLSLLLACLIPNVSTFGLLPSEVLSTPVENEIKVLSYENQTIAEISADIGNSNGVIYLRELPVSDNGTNAILTNSDNVFVNCSVFLGQYAYKIDKEVKVEKLYGTEYTTQKELDNLVDLVKNSYLSDEALQTIAERGSLSEMEIGDSWEFVKSNLLTGSLDYGDENFGTLSEWHSTYKIIANNYKYILHTFETYVTPNSNEKYRTSALEFNAYSPPKFLIRDYSPKAQTPSGTISLGSDLGGEIGGGGGKINAGISFNYSTIIDSPKVLDVGSLASEHIGIRFEYHDPWQNKGDYFDYNHNQSMQAVFYIYRKDLSSDLNYEVMDKRTVSVVRDGFWPWDNLTANFSLEQFYYSDDV